MLDLQLRTLSDGENMPADQLSVRQTQPFYSKGRKWAQYLKLLLKLSGSTIISISQFLLSPRLVSSVGH